MAKKRTEWIALRNGEIFSSRHQSRESAVESCKVDCLHWTDERSISWGVQPRVNHYSVGKFSNRRGIHDEQGIRIEGRK